jgi:hypothetical protein
MTDAEGPATLPASPPTIAPTVVEVEAICATADPVVRNLRITQAYAELSRALAARTGAGANWCTFATWASKQAGQTIRQEDFPRRIEEDLGRSEAVGLAVTRIGDFLRTIGHAADGHRIAGAVLEVLSPARALARTSAAVSRGNLKVFEDVGREFARFLAMLEDPGALAPEAIDRFCAGLRPGSSPEGQAGLRPAFAGYHRVLATVGAKARSEGLFLANLRIGLHEQVRLQPEILEALDAPAVDPRELRERLIERLLPDAPWLTWARIRVARWRGRLALLDEASRRLADAQRSAVRQAVTEKLATLALPGETLRLGRDVAGTFAEDLRTLADPDLVALLAEIDPAPDTLGGSGAEDWSSLPERMHFIADLFRTRHAIPSLLDPPFTPEQTRAIKAGERPPGPL